MNHDLSNGHPTFPNLELFPKSGSLEGTPKMKIFRSYNKFELENFNIILKDELENLTNHSYAEFEKVLKKN